MKKLIPIILLGLSILLIYLSQQTFYSYPIKTVYRYDGDYIVGGVRYDKDDNKLEEFTYSSYIKDGRLIDGKLTGYDEYMNMVLTDVEEVNNDTKRRLGTIILRGNNVVSISLL